MTERLMLLDTASLYFRAFYGVPDTVVSPDGTPINAVRGLLDSIAKLVTTYHPTALVACWDDDWRPAWRVELIPSYKAQRVADATEPEAEDVPDALSAQVPIIVEALGLLGIPVVGAPGYEADDVIGTLATRATVPVDIVTGDRDLFQLVDDARDVRVIYTARGMSRLEVVTDATVVTRYGVHAAQYADFATLRGDASDGLPGVAGIGEKTAASLLTAHGDLDGVIAAATSGHGMPPRLTSALDAARAYLAVAPTVVRVARDLDVDLDESNARLRAVPDPDVAAAFVATWGLGSAFDRAARAVAAAGEGPASAEA